MPEEKKLEVKAPISVKSEPIISEAMKIATKTVAETPSKDGLGEESIIKSVIVSLTKKSNDHTLSLNKALSYLSAALVQLEAHNPPKTSP